MRLLFRQPRRGSPSLVSPCTLIWTRQSNVRAVRALSSEFLQLSRSVASEFLPSPSGGLAAAVGGGGVPDARFEWMSFCGRGVAVCGVLLRRSDPTWCPRACPRGRRDRRVLDPAVSSRRAAWQCLVASPPARWACLPRSAARSASSRERGPFAGGCLLPRWLALCCCVAVERASSLSPLLPPPTYATQMTGSPICV